MKVILYMATSINGYIATRNHETPWSQEEFESYANKVKECGNLIIGKTTYNLMYEENAFKELGDPFVVVLTSSSKQPSRENTVNVNSFEEALKVSAGKGFTTALVGGGAQIDSEALKSGLLDEVYIDVEPMIIGKGIPLFSLCDLSLELKMVDYKKIGDSGMQIHYEVLK